MVLVSSTPFPTLFSDWELKTFSFSLEGAKIIHMR